MFVHGSVVNADLTWSAQKPLADRFDLVLPNRRGFPLGGWALAAVLWAAGEALGLWLTRLPTGADHLGSSGLVALAHSFRGIGVIVVLAAVTLANRDVGIAALVVYALAYSLSLGVSLLEYFGGEKLG